MKIMSFLNEKISKLMILALAIFLLGGVITFYQTKLNKIDVPDKIIAIKTEKTILQGHEITGADLIEKKVYKPDKLKNGITDMSDLIGKVALITIVKGKEITPSEITEKSKFFKDNEREVGLKFEHFTDIVGGKGKKGNMVDIMVSYNKDEFGLRDGECIVPGKEILEVMNEDNITYEKSKEKNSFKPLTAIFRLTSEEEVLVDRAMKSGRIYLRREGNYIEQEESSDEDTSSVDRVIIKGE